MQPVTNLPPGSFFNNDILAIYDIACRLPNSGLLVEIGSFVGRSATCWAQIFRQLGKKYRIYCLDTYHNSIEEIYKRNRNFENYFRDNPKVMTMNNFEFIQYAVRDYPEIICVEFDLFKMSPKDLGINQVDCVFDDSLHSKQSIEKCFDDWYPIINLGGVYCGHDYDSNFPTVVNTVNRIAQTNDLTVHNKDSSVFYFLK